MLAVDEEMPLERLLKKMEEWGNDARYVRKLSESEVQNVR
jgi:hypothetical protein